MLQDDVLVEVARRVGVLKIEDVVADVVGGLYEEDKRVAALPAIGA